MESDITEKRREDRFPFAKNLYCTNTKGEVFKGITVNMSKSGLCLYVYKILSEGESIKINDILPNSCREAVICWIRKIDDAFSMVGLNCL